MTSVLPPPLDRDWSDVWSHRDDLMRIARRRTPNEHDAEDVVQEAMLRAAARQLPPEALGPWLTRVVLNLCADLGRDRAKHPQRVAYTLRHLDDGTLPEQQVADRAEALWLAGKAAALPDRQRVALTLRAQGLGLDEVAEHLGASYKTAESLLSRARAALRTHLTSTFGVSAVAAVPWRWAKTAALPAATAAAVGAGLSAALLAPSAPDTDPPPSPTLAVPASEARPNAALRTRASANAPRSKAASAPAAPARPARNSMPAAMAPAPVPAPTSRVVLDTKEVGPKETQQILDVTVTEENSEESFEESFDRCLAHHTGDPSNLIEGTCPPDAGRGD